MENLSPFLLLAGLIFPAISWLTLFLSWYERYRFNRNSSSIFIPFFGPVLLASWLIVTKRPLWVISLAWIGDIGTVAFLVAAPALLKNEWRTSRFTQILELTGSQNDQSVVITLHKRGHFKMVKRWRRSSGETGIIQLGDLGTYMHDQNNIQLLSHFGLRRVVKKTQTAIYVVEREDYPEQKLENHSLQGWQLTVNSR